MNRFQKTILTIQTIRYLKWTQIWHRVFFRLYCPSPRIISCPNCNTALHSTVPFPKMQQCYLGNDVFLFLNEEGTFDNWNDKSRNKLWLYNLHYFDWLRQSDLSEEEGDRWIEKWIDENPPTAGCGWEPYTLSLRIVNWIKWDVNGHLLSEKAKESLATQIRFLRKRLEYHLLANHLLANAKALVFAGLFFDGDEAKKWLNKGLEIYYQQLPEQILPDGGHFELSPMYHSIILEDLLDLKNMKAPLELDDYIERMLYWLSVMTGPDGEIALFNDAAHGIALKPCVLQQYANSLGIRTKTFETPVLLRESGYARLFCNDLTLIADCGEIGPAYQPGHAHADALSFEVWKSGKKIIANSGTYRYYDSPERKYQRSSAAHNTVTVDNKNSSEVWGAHRVARRGHLIQRIIESPNTCSASFQTYSGIIHKRKWTIINSNRIDIDDTISGGGKTIQMFFSGFEGCFDLEKPSEFSLQKTKTLYSPEFGKKLHRTTYILHGIASHDQTIKTRVNIA